jgi:hypothetical protein
MTGNQETLQEAGMNDYVANLLHVKMLLVARCGEGEAIDDEGLTLWTIRVST